MFHINCVGALIPILRSVRCVHDRPPAVNHLALSPTTASICRINAIISCLVWTQLADCLKEYFASAVFLLPAQCNVGHILSGFVLFARDQEKSRRHNMEKPCQGFAQSASVGIYVMVPYWHFGWIAHLSDLLYCSVPLFTAIQEMHNGLGRVFDIHHGETVGFPWLAARTSTQSTQWSCQRQLNCGQNVGRLWSGPQDPAIVEM